MPELYKGIIQLNKEILKDQIMVEGDIPEEPVEVILAYLNWGNGNHYGILHKYNETLPFTLKKNYYLHSRKDFTILMLKPIE